MHLAWYWELLIAVAIFVTGVLVGWNNSKKSLLKKAADAANKKADTL